MNDLSSTQYSPLGESDEKGIVDHMKLIYIICADCQLILMDVCSM